MILKVNALYSSEFTSTAQRKSLLNDLCAWGYLNDLCAWGYFFILAFLHTLPDND